MHFQPDFIFRLIDFFVAGLIGFRFTTWLCTTNTNQEQNKQNIFTNKLITTNIYKIDVNIFLTYFS